MRIESTVRSPAPATFRSCSALVLASLLALSFFLAPSALSQTLGEQRTLVTLVNFQNDPATPLTPAQVELELLDASNAASTASYVLEASYARAWLTGSASGWHTMPWDDTTCFVATDTGSQQVLDALDPLVDWSLVDHWILYIPFQSSCAFLGYSSLGKKSFVSDEGIVSLSRMILNGRPAPSLGPLGAHEIGHGFGLSHARDYECGAVTAADDCEASPWLYGERYDVLGNTAGYGHFNPPNKDVLGWLDTQVVDVVPPGGTYFLEPYAAPGAGVKSLRVPVEWLLDDFNVSTHYYVSYRRPVGFDASFGELATDGAMLHLDAFDASSGKPGITRLLDASPHVDADVASQDVDSSDVLLEIGESYVDTEHGITITAVGLSGGDLEVDVAISQYCGNAAIDPNIGEQCDGALLAGATCESIGYASGTLACSASCAFDTSSCGAPRCGVGHAYDPLLDVCTATISSDEADGGRWRNRELWTDVREATASALAPNETYFINVQQSDRSWIYRTSFPFDTTSLPDGATLLSADLALTVTELASPTVNTHPDSADQLVLVETTFDNPPFYDYLDFDEFGSLDDPIELAPRIDVGDDITSEVPFAFHLNAAGLTAIDDAGWTMLGVRGGYDVDDVTHSGEQVELRLRFFTSTSASNAPRLVVTYAPVPEPGFATGLAAAVAALFGAGTKRRRFRRS